MVITRTAEERPRLYTAIVSIHGIGRHSKHETVGRLADALSAFIRQTPDEGRGRLVDHRPDIEPSRDPSMREDVAFLRLAHVRSRIVGASGRRRTRKKDYRIYEVNWSPLTKQGLGLSQMLGWMASCLLRICALTSHDWSKLTRVRLARLHAVRLQDLGEDVPHLWAVMAGAYRRFIGTQGREWRAARGDTRARGEDFRRFYLASVPAQYHQDFVRLFGRWGAARLPVEMRLRWILFGVALLLAVGALTALDLVTIRAMYAESRT